MNKVLPTAVVMALGCLLFLGGLTQLYSIFGEERKDAQMSLDERRTALQGYAQRVLERWLSRDLRDQAEKFDQALSDPLIATSGMLFVKDGEQLLPRIYSGVPPPIPIKAFYNQLREDARKIRVNQEGPFKERVEDFVRLQNAVAKGNETAISETFRSILGNRSVYVVDPALDFPYMVALISYFQETSDPHPNLLKGLVIEGLPNGQGGKLPGLMPELLNNRHNFTKEDFEFLAGELSKVAAKAGLAHDDFDQRVKESSGARVALPRSIEEPSLVRGTWYVERPREGVVLGIAIRLPDLLTKVTEEMRHRQMLGEDETLKARAEGGTDDMVALSRFQIEVESPRWSTLRDQIDSRFLKKVVGLGLSGVLAIGFALMIVMYQLKSGGGAEAGGNVGATVVSELRTPLSSARLLADTLYQKLQGTPETGDVAQRLLREIDGVSTKLQNTVTNERLNMGWTAKPQDLQLSELVGELTRDLELHTGGQSRVSAEGVDGVMFKADPQLTRLLLKNLGYNACQSTEARPVEVEVKARQGLDGTSIEVRDNSAGIPAADWENVFADFYQAPQGQNGGLGLAVCRKIMELHGGSIAIKSSSPTGTTFKIDFPGKPA